MDSAYIARVKIAHATNAATKKLIVLDLNGTLFARVIRATVPPVLRPGLSNFLDYVLRHFDVMVWSTMVPKSTAFYVERSFTPEQRNRLLSVWDRDVLNLLPSQYEQKSVTTHKDLRLVWSDTDLRKFAPTPDGWSQDNTILIDDSYSKGELQPFNQILVPTFRPDNTQDHVLDDVIHVLQELQNVPNVSHYLWKRKFSRQNSK
ncbi:phosphoprotein phosphatase [Schizosaccharomyces japonicus yFS275]|uniref:Mitochondrial import inner membrane translocase subunit TIM50 n=1 Tax=Schizosaccharomyces japonicus (strain yFS275 / FY16936) TaxID=402676 RepID=B6K0L1_SCHJY|nr:phosphoprotein phosphatase [Schizosaccharomyces japonicus yFS275]EEB07482.2 phosphoprotein phosphatase [Schizosaccharomyces japonicus yFS275]